jgi:hypothetical protein
MRPAAAQLLTLTLVLTAASLLGQDVSTPAVPASSAPQGQTSTADATQPSSKALKTHPELTPEEKAEALRISKLAIVNGVPYDQPSEIDKFLYYLNDSYGLPAAEGALVRASYGQLRGKPSGWGTDFPGFGQRLGSGYAVSAIDGNVRYGMEEIFHEDLRYIPCHGCSAKKKVINVLLSEVTARHDETGKRFFTVTPLVADFSGPIVAHSFWYPGGSDPEAGVVAARLLFATRIGGHLFREFVIERFHKDKPYDR